MVADVVVNKILRVSSVKPEMKYLILYENVRYEKEGKKNEKKKSICAAMVIVSFESNILKLEPRWKVYILPNITSLSCYYNK